MQREHQHVARMRHPQQDRANSGPLTRSNGRRASASRRAASSSSMASAPTPSRSIISGAKETSAAMVWTGAPSISERRAQRLVPANKFAKRTAERDRIEGPVNPECNEFVVGAAAPDAVEEPQARLPGRQRRCPQAIYRGAIRGAAGRVATADVSRSRARMSCRCLGDRVLRPSPTMFIRGLQRNNDGSTTRQCTGFRDDRSAQSARPSCRTIPQ